MPLFLIIIIEILVRLVFVLLCAIGAYELYSGMKNPHHVWGVLVGLLALGGVITIFTPSSYAAKNRLTFQHTYTAAEKKANHRHAVAASESRVAASESRVAASESRATVAASNSKKKTSSEAVANSKRAKSKSESESLVAQGKAIHESLQKESKANSKKNTVNVGGIKYKKVSLENFTENPEKYDATNIQTSGQVIYIQKNPDNKNMYFVVIVPKDEYSSSGSSDGHGSVTEISIDTMHDTPVHEGDYITVNGGGLTSTATLNGKTLKSDIIVDTLTVH